jgi:hypothetical protein
VQQEFHLSRLSLSKQPLPFQLSLAKKEQSKNKSRNNYKEGGPCPRLKFECPSIFKPATQLESPERLL